MRLGTIISNGEREAYVVGITEDGGIECIGVDVKFDGTTKLSRHSGFSLDADELKEWTTTTVYQPKASWRQYLMGDFSLQDIVTMTGRKWRTQSRVPYVVEPGNKGLADIVRPFLGTDNLRPIMSLVNFDEAGATATNAHILIHIYGKVPESRHGTYDLAGKKRDEGRYPLWRSVTPTDFGSVHTVDVEELYNLSGLLLDSYLINNITNSFKCLYTVRGTKTPIAINAVFLNEALRAMLKIGGKWHVGLNEPNRAMVWFNTGKDTLSIEDDTYVLTMPVTLMDAAPNAKQVKMDNKRTLDVSWDFDQNSTITGTDTPTDLRALMGAKPAKLTADKIKAISKAAVKLAKQKARARVKSATNDRLRMAKAKAAAAAARIRILKLKE